MAYTILGTNAGNVQAVSEWLHQQKEVNVFDWLTERWPKSSTVGIEVASGKAMETGRVTAISEHAQNPQPHNDHDNKLRDNLGRQYTTTVVFPRVPYAMTLGLDEFEQSKTATDLTREASGALGRSTGRLKMDIMVAALSLGDDAISTASAAAMRNSLRNTDTWETRADVEGIGTAHCVTESLKPYNVFFTSASGLLDPSDVGAGTFTQIMSDPQNHQFTYDTMEALPDAAEARLLEPVQLTVNGAAEDLYIAILPPSIYRDLLQDPDRREMQLYAEVRGMDNSIFKGRPSFLYYNNILCVKATNRVDSWTQPGDESATAYPGHSPLRVKPITTEGNSGWSIGEIILLGKQSFGESMWKAVTLAESVENDGGTKPWMYSKFVFGATKTKTVTADNSTRFRSGSVIATMRNGWNT